jgi:hypothetical protein
MSHTHIRVAKPEPVPGRYEWLPAVLLGLALAALAIWMMTGRWDGFIDQSYSVAEGQVLGTRIVVDHIFDGRNGGSIYYRIEAHISYKFQGQMQDRWLLASDITTERERLAAKLATQPKQCLVYWKPDFPENPRCRFE